MVCDARAARSLCRGKRFHGPMKIFIAQNTTTITIIIIMIIKIVISIRDLHLKPAKCISVGEIVPIS